MKLVNFSIFTLATSLATASPLAVGKRTAGANEAIYLTDCMTKSTTPQQWSQYSWYEDGRHKSQNGEAPDAIARINGLVGYVLWERGVGSSQCAWFGQLGDSVSACAEMPRDAATHNVGEKAGNLRRNGVSSEQQWTCYKDSGRILYQTSGVQCRSKYYCFP
ncbi:hypothetical protein B0H67DRAFT_24903 [Lasiosphaeris hirsuta]|uniref:Uncharacterized protein n=1 Tax=Lasiosphaeris hirsuta TaxID=260670 RepID=A0AA40B9J4_9PEZI|nr:hypothetical protein B0H67DRAFT_24903 [Lasiosphaeris hirsuta]